MMSDMPERWRLIWAANDTCADLLYATGFVATDPFLWLQANDQQLLVVGTLELARACKEVKPGIEVLSLDAARQRYSATDSDPVAIIKAIASNFDQSNWQVPADFPLLMANHLHDAGVFLNPVPIFFPQRRGKTSAEIEAVRQGVELAEIGLAHALSIIEACDISSEQYLFWQGQVLTAQQLRGEIDAIIARHGGIAIGTIAAPGTQGADPHRVGSGPIAAHQPIVLDIFPRVSSTGYYGDLTRTVVKGKAPEIVVRAYAAVREAQRRAIDTAAVGVKLTQIHTTVESALQQAGFASDRAAFPPYGFFHGTGHGLGLQVHEAPRIISIGTDVLQPGDVVTIEPGLYYRQWGGVRLEDVIAVHADNRIENLTTAPFVLEIA